MHPLLERQLRKLGIAHGDSGPDGAVSAPLLEHVSRTYQEADQERYLLERSLAIASAEMQELYRRLKEASDERYRELFEEAPVMYVLTANNAGEPRISDCNGATLRTLGYERSDLIGKPLKTLYLPERRDRQRERRPGEHRQATEECTLVASDGRTIEAIVRIAPERGADGAATGARIMFVDVSERKDLQRQLAHQAFHDRLTSLPNRALFLDRLDHAIKRRIDRDARNCALALLDLDDFKLINDSLGHSVGDELLVHVSQRLREALRPGDTLARLGGDEFAILLEDIRSDDEALTRFDSLAQLFRIPFTVSARDVFIGASIGVVVVPCGAKAGSPAALLRQADIAMYEAKRRHGCTVHLFDESLESRSSDRLDLESDLRRAIDNCEFVVYYQPIVDLPTGRVDEFEALVRWQHPTRGLLVPAEFLPLAEETGLIVQIGIQVLQEVCCEAQAWRALYPARPFRIAVNLSCRQLERRDIVAEVEHTLAATGLPASFLKLEVTESTMMADVEHAEAVLLRFRELGISLAIDDFGTGYSSLTYLKRLPVDTVKIDRSFVLGLDSVGSDAAIIEAVLAFAATMNLTVTGEGVESESQEAQLRSMGCHHAQGFFYSRPLPGDQARLFLQRPFLRAAA